MFIFKVLKKIKYNQKTSASIWRMKNTRKKLNSQTIVVKSSFQQVDVASSLSKIQATLVLHSFIATFPGINITRYSWLNAVAKYMNSHNILKFLGKTFPTELLNATKFFEIKKSGAITLFTNMVGEFNAKLVFIGISIERWKT